MWTLAERLRWYRERKGMTQEALALACDPPITQGIISPEHPATIRAQVEAALARAGCAWCPRLRDLDTWELYQWGRGDVMEERSR